MSEAELMPVLEDARRQCAKLGLPCPAGYPFEWFRREGAFLQAMSNHGQTPERLRERGGLDPREAVAILKGVGYWTAWPGTASSEERTRTNMEEALTWLAGYGARFAEGIEG